MNNPTNDKQLEELRDKITCITGWCMHPESGTCPIYESYLRDTGDDSPSEDWDRQLDDILQLIQANREQYAAEKVREELIKLSLTQKQKDNIEKRAYAVKLSQLGFSYGKIGKVMGVGKSTVQFWLRKQTNPNQGDKSE